MYRKKCLLLLSAGWKQSNELNILKDLGALEWAKNQMPNKTIATNEVDNIKPAVLGSIATHGSNGLHNTRLVGSCKWLQIKWGT